MFQLPFHVDSPLPAGVFCLALAIASGGLWWAYVSDVAIGRWLKWYFHRRFRVGGEVNQQRAETAGWYVLAFLTVAFAAIALFGLSVGLGLIKNGDSPYPSTSLVPTGSHLEPRHATTADL